MKHAFFSSKALLVVFFVVLTLEAGGLAYEKFFAPLGFIPIRNVKIEEIYTPPDSLRDVIYFGEESKSFFADTAKVYGFIRASNMENARQVREFVRSFATNSGNVVVSDSPIELFKEYQKEGGTLICGAVSFMEAGFLQGFGIPVRIIQFIQPQGATSPYFPKITASHITVEVWSEYHRKWYISDPTFNVRMFDGNGIPLSAAELRNMKYSFVENTQIQNGDFHPSYAAAVRVDYGKIEDDGSALDKRNIPPLLLSEHIFILTGEKPQGLLAKIKNRYTKAYSYSYVTDISHPVLILPAINIFLDYIGPFFLIFLGGACFFVIMTNRKLYWKKFLSFYEA